MFGAHREGEAVFGAHRRGSSVWSTQEWGQCLDHIGGEGVFGAHRGGSSVWSKLAAYLHSNCARDVLAVDILSQPEVERRIHQTVRQPRHHAAYGN